MHAVRYATALATSLAALALAPPATAQEAPAPSQPGEPRTGAAPDDNAKASAVETAQPRRGSVTIAGKRIDYTATPGTLTLHDDDGAPVASMFYVAYTSDRAAGARERPVTFVYNGGPGSSTMWLHIGSFGPDMATPFSGTEYDLKHMQLDPQLKPNLSFKYHDSGHMACIEPATIRQMRADLLAFYDSATQ